MNTCAVVIPIYEKNLSARELENIKISLFNLAGFDIYFYGPDSLCTNFYSKQFINSRIERFADHYFTSIQNYSRLMLSDEFYQRFENYSHLLICQPDAVALKPELNYWINQPYDYIGAPWPKGYEYTFHLDFKQIPEGVKSSAFVGNGGFSLRKVKSCQDLFQEFPEIRRDWIDLGHAEDLFFSLTSSLSKKFRVPNLMIAALFSHETEPEFLYKLIGNNIPFGCHAYEKYGKNHWNKLIPDYFRNTE